MIQTLPIRTAMLVVDKTVRIFMAHVLMKHYGFREKIYSDRQETKAPRRR